MFQWCAEGPSAASPGQLAAASLRLYRGDLTLLFTVDRAPLQLWQRQFLSLGQDGVCQGWWRCLYFLRPPSAPGHGTNCSDLLQGIYGSFNVRVTHIKWASWFNSGSLCLQDCTAAKNRALYYNALCRLNSSYWDINTHSYIMNLFSISITEYTFSCH